MLFYEFINWYVIIVGDICVFGYQNFKYFRIFWIIIFFFWFQKIFVGFIFKIFKLKFMRDFLLDNKMCNMVDFLF